MAPQFQRALLGSHSEIDLASTVATIGGPSANGGHTPRCQQVPTYTTRRKPGASDGERGSSGLAPTAVLTPGRDGLDGTAAIIIRSDDGSVSTYDSKFEFQLLDFEVVDQNNDNIFEPGECAIIKNIRIKNSGTTALTLLRTLN